MKKALVLSGGGSKGAYQLGVWKALKKLNVQIDIVTGTSIGALNGCLIVQNDYDKALSLWNNLSFSSVFNKEIKINNELEVYKEYIEEFIKNGGMDISILEKTIKDNVDQKKFYASKIDFGLVTFKINNLKPILLTKKDIKEELLVDYLVASATCFPAFKLKKINDDFYIDGGYYDNLPVNLAHQMGANEIIAVDLQEIGFKKSINKKIKNITYITPKNKLKNFLFFDKEEAKKQIKLGYNDTMKIYKKLYGNSFSFNKIFYSINEFAYFKKFIKNFENKSKVVTKLGKTVKYMHYHQIIENENPKEIFLNSIEYLMNILDLQEEDIWNILNVNHIIKEEMSKINSISFKNLEKIIKNKEEVNEKVLVKTIYDLMINNDQKKLNIILLLSKELYLAALYLYTIKN